MGTPYLVGEKYISLHSLDEMARCEQGLHIYPLEGFTDDSMFEFKVVFRK